MKKIKIKADVVTHIFYLHESITSLKIVLESSSYYLAEVEKSKQLLVDYFEIVYYSFIKDYELKIIDNELMDCLYEADCKESNFKKSLEEKFNIEIVE